MPATLTRCVSCSTARLESDLSVSGDASRLAPGQSFELLGLGVALPARVIKVNLNAGGKAPVESESPRV